MPNTYTQIHIHAVFVVKYRDAVIKEEWREELFKYITGIIQKNGHKMLQINGVADHIHLFFGMRPKQALSELIKEVKQSSSGWINRRDLTGTKFYWQEGFAAFSHSRSQVPAVINYIKNQQEHHRKRTFREEYLKMLNDFEVDFDEKYLFQELQ
jgi:REP element-mobilizing transposase RayT